MPDIVPPVPLLASLLSPAPDDFLDTLVGRLQRMLRERPAPGLSSDSVGQVLRALLHHDGWHSNRVWAGIARLAAVAGVGERTVRRVLQWLRALGLLRAVTGEELYRGPGPHQWPTEKRRGKLETTCYDLSGLAPLIPAAFRAAVSPRVSPREMPPLGPEFPDPFADPPSIPHSQETEQTPVCPVSRAEEEPEKAGKAAVPMAAPSPFAGPDMAAIRERGKEEEVSPRLAPGDETIAFRGLREQRIAAPVARALLADRGPRWCLLLLAYGRWTRRRKALGPGWYVAVWQHWRRGDGGWPDDFSRWHARETAHAARVQTARRQTARVQAPRVQAPRRPAPPRSPVASGKPSLAALTDRERAALESRARTELHTELGRAPVPPLVRSRMLALLAQGMNGSGNSAGRQKAT